MSSRTGKTYFYGSPKQYVKALRTIELVVNKCGGIEAQSALRQLEKLADFFSAWHKLFRKKSLDPSMDDRLLQEQAASLPS